MGVSVGKIIHYLHALINQSWVKALNVHRYDSNRAYAHLLTPSGAVAKIRIARAFLAREECEEREFEQLEREIATLRNEVLREERSA